MIPDQVRREVSTKNQFSFSNPKHGATDGRNSLDGIEYGAWAERIKGKHGYFGRSDDHIIIGAWTRRASFSNHGYNKYDGEEELRWLAKQEDDDSGTPSPPLWKNASSPTRTRAQEIARYRQEMLDMVHDMPESDYELSLRDMVESPTPSIEKNDQERMLLEETRLSKDVEEKDQKKLNKKKKKKARSMSRSEGMQTGGLLLKMFFPMSLGERKSRSSGESNTHGKVPPRILSGQKGGLGRDDGGQCRNELCGIGSSSNSSSSSKDSCSSSRSKRTTSCFFLPHELR